MRERRPEDWAFDLKQRRGIEQFIANAIEECLRLHLVERRTESFDQPDFVVATRQVARAELELKAKWQRSPTWRRHLPGVPERELFILDERAFRHLIGAGPDAHLLIYDHPNRRWVLFDLPRLTLSPIGRTSRPLRRERPVDKGKVLLDLRNGVAAGVTPAQAIATTAHHINLTHRNWSQLEPWPS